MAIYLNFMGETHHVTRSPHDNVYFETLIVRCPRFEKAVILDHSGIHGIASLDMFLKPAVMLQTVFRILNESATSTRYHVPEFNFFRSSSLPHIKSEK